jgi:hypothetical protein
VSIGSKSSVSISTTVLGYEALSCGRTGGHG